MNKEQRAALRKLAEEATPGPWYCENRGDEYCDDIDAKGTGGWKGPVTLAMNVGKDNASHIAAANPSTILQLLDYIEMLESALQNAKDTFECLCGENSTERLMCNDAVRVINSAMQGETE